MRQQRQLDIDTLALKPGNHNPNSGDMCIMEAVAYIAGEPWSDHPECVSPVIGAFLRRLNDRVSDGQRQELKPYIMRIIGSAADNEIELQRAWECADWAIRECLPLLFDARGQHHKAHRLRALGRVTADNWQGQVRAAHAAHAANAAGYAAAAAYAARADAAAAHAATAAGYAGYAAANAAGYAARAARAAANAADAAYAAADAAADADAETIFRSALSLIDRLLAD